MMNRAELKANQMVQINGGRMFTVFGEKGDCPTSESYEKKHWCNYVGHKEEPTFLWMTQGYDIYECVFCHKRFESEV